MPENILQKNHSAGKLRASIEKHNTINMVVLFADYVDSKRRFHIVPKRVNSLSDILVFLSSPPECPSCNNSKMTLSERWSPKEWFLKYFGRRVFHCNNCGQKYTIKLHQWESETIITAVVIALIPIFYALYWVTTSK